MSKTIPKLRFKEFKEGITPKKLDELIIFRSGGTPAKDDAKYWDGNIPWISAASMIGKYYSRSERTLSELGLNNGSKLAPQGSLLLLVRGSMLFNKIPIGIVATDVAFNQDLKNLIPKEDTIADYLYQWFSSKENLLLDKVVGTGLGAGKLDTEDLKNLSVYLPTLPEQQKIASFLSAVDEKIQQLTRKKELLEQYKKGVMQRLFCLDYDSFDLHDSPDVGSNHSNQKNHPKSQFRQLRFKDENGKPYPKWEEKRLGEVAKLQGGYAFKSEMFQASGTPVIRISNISNENNFIDLNNLVYYQEIPNSDNFIIKSGDLILAMSGATTGKSSIYNLPYNAYLNQRVGLFKLKSTKLHYPYLVQFVFSDEFKKQLDSVLVAGAQPNVSSSDIESFKFQLPSIEEQQKIASFLTALDTKIESVATQITQSQTFKKGLLQQMFV